MTAQSPVRDGILAALPSLRAFAISLAHDVTLADDLVQETILRALKHVDRFELGTNLNAWLFTILRNLYFSYGRKKKREVEDADGSYAAKLSTAPSQHDRLDIQDMRTALAKLPPTQREAVLLVSASGFSYEEASSIMGVAVGTVKSRVNRGRVTLAKLLSIDRAEDLGTDQHTRAALQVAA
jgi:RNA polymerase sigma-70 factor (ECF subfamily)